MKLILDKTVEKKITLLYDFLELSEDDYGILALERKKDGNHKYYAIKIKKSELKVIENPPEKPKSQFEAMPEVKQASLPSIICRGKKSLLFEFEDDERHTGFGCIVEG